MNTQHLEIYWFRSVSYNSFLFLSSQ